MLDILRRHASSWAIKVPIAAIIISFAFFFGYSAMRRQGKGASEKIVARVNDRPVSAAEFEYYLDRNYEGLRQSFKDKDIPDFIAEMAKSTTMQQMVTREMMLQQTEDLGIFIPDNELADVIKEIQTQMQGGQFDPLFYRQRFLPHFKNRYGLDYEKFVKQELGMESFRNIFNGIDQTPILDDANAGGAGNETWTFEMVELEPAKMVEEKTVKNEDEAKALAEEIVKTSPSKWKGKLKNSKLEAKKIGPIGIAQRKQLAESNLPFEKMISIFKLTEENPVIDKPIEDQGKLYVVRLIEKSKTNEEIKPQTDADSFFRMWMSKLLAKAKIESYLDKEQRQ